nr:MAG TPA: hypothetical protein [Caudoviricetes sp.]
MGPPCPASPTKVTPETTLKPKLTQWALSMVRGF